MRKFLMTFLAVAFSVTAVRAADSPGLSGQAVYRESDYSERITRPERTSWSGYHDIRMSVSGPSVVLLINAQTLSNKGRYDLISSSGPLFMTPTVGLNYMYGFRRWLSLEGGISVANASGNRYDYFTDELIGRNNITMVSVSALVRFTYYSRGMVTLYSSLGLSFMIEDLRYGHEKTYSTTYDFFPEVRLFGITFGRRLYGFAEIGAGASGFAGLGIGYRF